VAYGFWAPETQKSMSKIGWGSILESISGYKDHLV